MWGVLDVLGHSSRGQKGAFPACDSFVVRNRFGRFGEDVIRRAVIDGWGLDLHELRYFPEGGGAYHWVAGTADGPRWFVTVDDLDTKPWLGHDRDSVFDGLVVAYSTAIGLQLSGEAFVGAAETAISGAAARRIDDRHSLAIFKYIDGHPGRWGQQLSLAGLSQVVAMLAQLHQHPGPRNLPTRTKPWKRYEVSSKDENHPPTGRSRPPPTRWSPCPTDPAFGARGTGPFRPSTMEHRTAGADFRPLRSCPADLSR